MGKAAYLSTSAWQRARKAALRRDGYRCTDCGKAGRMEVHHVKPLWKFPDQDPFFLDGLACLCRGCHIRTTRVENELYGFRKAPPNTWSKHLDELT